MDRLGSAKRKYWIAGGAVAAAALGAAALGLVYPVAGPIMGTLAPQAYVETIAEGDIPAKGPFVLVDAASARLFMIRNGRVEDSMKVIVGKPDTPAPIIAGTIHYATFNPYWNIPTDVIRRNVAPLVAKRGAKYLAAARYEVASDWSENAAVVAPDEVDWTAVAKGEAEVRLRQLPGPGNMMGKLKFGFVNDLAALATHPALRRVEVETPAGPASIVAPAAIRDRAAPVLGPVPAIGQHDAAIRREFGAAASQAAE